MALPGIFHPVIRDGRVLVDGGVIMPVPVEAVRMIAPGLPVVAINLQNDYARRALAVGLRVHPKPVVTSLSVLRSATGLMLSRLARQSLALSTPDLELPLPVDRKSPRLNSRH